MHKKYPQRRKRFTTHLQAFCLKKNTATCAYKTFWTQAVWHAARSMPITKQKKICSNRYARRFSDTCFHTLSRKNKATIFQVVNIRLQALHHSHFLSLARRKTLVHAILLSQSKDVFLTYLRGELNEFATACVENNFVNGKDLPKSLKVNSVIENFILLVEYWDSTAFADTPEKLTEYFIVMNS